MFEDIKEQFSNVIQFSQRIPEPKLDELFDEWYKSKKRFINLFGDKLIYECPKPVEFTLDKKSQKNRVMEFADFIYDSFNNSELAEFIDNNAESFYENCVTDTSQKDIPKGMKLIKAFKYFEDNKNKLHKIQDLASQLIQENKIKGTLCLSVHPLDFLSSSENTYNWRSCHSLDGDYRAGNLSYMVDDVTFVAYLKGVDNVHLPAFGEEVLWNSKKWRMLLHYSQDERMIFAGRQYPFFSRAGMDKVLEEFTELDLKVHNFLYTYPMGKWSEFYVDKVVNRDGCSTFVPFRYLYSNGAILKLEGLIEKGVGALNYNDLLDSSTYIHPFFAARKNARVAEIPKKQPIIVGKGVKCLHCGENHITMSGTMRCDRCELEYGYEESEDITTCACCGTRIWTDSSTIVEPYGDIVCDNCFDSECFVCEACGCVFYNKDKRFIEEYEQWYCPGCYEDFYEMKKEKRTVHFNW